MAGVQDPLTDLPPPSRLDFEELSNFRFDSSSVSPPPPAFFSPASSGCGKLHTPLLFITSSPSGLHLLQNLPGKRLIGSVVLPEPSSSEDDKEGPKRFSDDGMLEKQSVYDGRVPTKKESGHVCPVYSLDAEQSAMVMVPVANTIPEERASSWARVLLEALAPKRVLMVATVQRESFRGKLSADDQIVFQLETDQLRLEEGGRGGHCGLPYFPSGSVVSGLPAAVLTRCQLLGLKGRLLLSWPEAGPCAPVFISSVLGRLTETSGLDFSPSLQVPFKGKLVSDLDIYF